MYVCTSDLLQPADEVAEEAGYTEGEEEPVVTSVEIQHVRGVYICVHMYMGVGEIV